MSKFKIKLKLTGLELEVEGTREDAPKIAARIGEQLSGFLQPTTLLENSNGASHRVIDAKVDGNGAGRKKRAGRKPSSASGTKLAVDEFTFVHDSAKFGTPQMDWKTKQKAIWFLWIAGEQANIKQQTASSIANNFNKYFREAKTINNGNVGRDLEREKLKGTSAPVGSDVSDGTTKYFLTKAGIAMAERLAKGDTSTE